MKPCLADGCEKEARVKFCSNKCKDDYHNDKKSAWKADRNEYWEDDHPFSGEGIGQD